MSFADLDSSAGGDDVYGSSYGVGDFDFFGNQPGAAREKTEQEKWNDLQQQIFDGIKGLATSVPLATSLIRKLGTIEDSADLHSRIRSRMQENDTHVQTVTNGMGDMKKLLIETANPSDLEDRKIIVAKLTRDFQAWLVKYKEASQALKQKERQGHSVQPQNSSRGDVFGYGQEQANSERQALLAKQMHAVDNELDLHELIVEERETQIRGIESKIVEVNDIFRDLGIIVEEQGQIVDHIGLTIAHAKDDTDVGVVELKKAQGHQKSAGSKVKCIALLCFLIMIIVIVVVIVAVVVFGK